MSCCLGNSILKWRHCSRGRQSTTRRGGCQKGAIPVGAVQTVALNKGVGRSEWVLGKRVGFAHSLTQDPQGVGF